MASCSCRRAQAPRRRREPDQGLARTPQDVRPRSGGGHRAERALHLGNRDREEGRQHLGHEEDRRSSEGRPR